MAGVRQVWLLPPPRLMSVKLKNLLFNMRTATGCLDSTVHSNSPPASTALCLCLPASSAPSPHSNSAGKTLTLYKLTVQAAVRPLWQMMWKLPSCCCCRLPACPMLLPLLPLLLLPLLPLPQVQLEQFHNSLTIINASSVERQTALASQKFGAPIQGSPQAKPRQRQRQS